MTERLLGATTGLCAHCKRSVPAHVVRVDGRVVLRKQCAEHGAQEVELSSNADWYEATLAEAPVLAPPLRRHPVTQGCPYDCGACAAHAQALHLPVLPITSSCGLACPICYTHNENHEPYRMDARELAGILDVLRVEAPERRIVNLTGGEPTEHPGLAELVEACHREGVRRITISTHGLRLLGDEPLVARLAALDARVILAFDSMSAEGNRSLLGGDVSGKKRAVLALLGRHRVATTLLAVAARGINDQELWPIIALGLAEEHVRSVELHPMTFTGSAGVAFARGARLGAYEVLAAIEQASGGALAVSDFVPSPLAHPLCYQMTYLLRLEDGRWLPFPRFMPRSDLRELLSEGLYLEPSARMEETLRVVIDRLWAGELPCADTALVLASLKAMIGQVFDPDLGPAEQIRAGERFAKAVYVHTHMDEETFDTDRIARCCVGMPEADGRWIPSCAYNVLYRERDPRFMRPPRAPLATLGPGRKG